jgi:hypothetical protein
MRENNCEIIRRELDELMLDESYSTSAITHLKECAACREFHDTQTKLRRMVGSVGTVAAPADFDFRLRARLANDSTNGAFHYWPLVQRGLTVAAVVIVFAFGVVVVKNLVDQPKATVVENTPPPQPPAPQNETRSSNPPAPSDVMTAGAPTTSHDKNRNGRPAQTALRIKRPMVSQDFSKTGVGRIPASEAFSTDAGTAFSIDASLEPLRLSLDDGRGNAKTISVPTIRFGSQQMLPNRNQLAQKGIW